MKKSVSIVTIADSQKARIFEKIGHQDFELNLLSELEANKDDYHEKPGRSFNRFGKMRHAIEPHTDRRDVERRTFAEKISGMLNQLQEVKNADRLILLTSHQLLEDLDEVLSEELQKKISHKFTKDLSKFTNSEVKDYLEKNLEKMNLNFRGNINE